MHTLLSILYYYCLLLPQLLHHVEFNVVHDVFQNIVLMEYATFLIAYCTRELSKGTMTSKLYIVDDDATVVESQHIFSWHNHKHQSISLPGTHYATKYSFFDLYQHFHPKLSM